MGRTWILALSAFAVAGLGPAPAVEDQPPLSPGSETAVSPPQTPHAECVAKLIKALTASHGRLQRAMVSRSRRWGDVWRADFETDDVEPPLINRAVCWQGTVQMATAQSLAPLPLSATASAPMTSSIQPAGVQCIHTPFVNPCRGDPVEMVSLCVRPGVYVYPDGRSEPAQGGESFEVGYFNHGGAESDAQWAARCAPRGGVYREGDEP